MRQISEAASESMPRIALSDLTSLTLDNSAYVMMVEQRAMIPVSEGVGVSYMVFQVGVSYGTSLFPEWQISHIRAESTEITGVVSDPAIAPRYR